MIELGSFALIVALILAIYAAVAGIIGGRASQYGERRLVASAEHAGYVVCIALSTAVLVLEWALVTRQFQVKYVANYTSNSLPIPYTIAALWAGQAGSLLLWGWLVSVFYLIVSRLYRSRHPELMPYVTSVMMGIAAFFVFLNIFLDHARPFILHPVTLPDGQGLNPLLQHPGMAAHPPVLYLGYVGFTVPYAFAMAALLSRQVGDTWIRTTRRWTLFPWFCLGIGMLMGGRWAYDELGWGGYWAWDPVENAAMMPWLTGTAFLHSVMIQEKKDMLKIWNMILIILTFTLCIFGTFLTRSGVVSSVHSFTQSAIGPFFSGFVVVILLSSFGLLLSRLDDLKAKSQLEAIVSRESGFLLNNLIFLGLTFAVLWGTIFPVISEAVRGVKITVGPPFFNKINIPIGLFLLFLTGAGPLFAWRKTSLVTLRHHFLIPAIIALIGGGVLFVAGIRHFYALMSFTIGIFVTGTVVSEFYRGMKARSQATGEPYITALWNLLWKNKRRYGGYIVHLGIVALFIGFTGKAFTVEGEGTLNRGESLNVRNYTLRYDDFFQDQDGEKMTVGAIMTIYRDGKKVGILRPSKRFYPRQQQNTTEVAKRSILREDLYVVLASQNSEDGTATFHVFINPLVRWVWIGGWVLALGTVVIMAPDRKKGRQRMQQQRVLQETVLAEG